MQKLIMRSLERKKDITYFPSKKRKYLMGQLNESGLKTIRVTSFNLSLIFKNTSLLKGNLKQKFSHNFFEN